MFRCCFISFVLRTLGFKKQSYFYWGTFFCSGLRIDTPTGKPRGNPPRLNSGSHIRRARGTSPNFAAGLGLWGQLSIQSPGAASRTPGVVRFILAEGGSGSEVAPASPGILRPLHVALCHYTLPVLLTYSNCHHLPRSQAWYGRHLRRERWLLWQKVPAFVRPL